MVFFKTKEPNPIFIFEEWITKIGECRLEIGKEYESFNERKIKTIMKFGGTFFDVIAIHLKSGKSVKQIWHSIKPVFHVINQILKIKKNYINS